MNTKIYCEESKCGTLSFYITVNEKKHYLFTQKYKRSVDEYFKKPISIKDAIDFSKSRRDFAIMNTMEKLPKYIRYFERTSKISVLKKTVKSKYHSVVCDCA